MTLILAATSKDWLWMLADRRLTVRGNVVKRDATKVMRLNRTNGNALLGYSGLGKTVSGNEPSHWMSNVLRGTNQPLEESLGILTAAASRQLPRHLVQTNQRGVITHSIVIPAFLEDSPRVYSIDLAVPPGGGRHFWRYTRYNRSETGPLSKVSPRIVMAGSGAPHLVPSKRKWEKHLLGLVKAHCEGRVSAEIVAGYMATLNQEVAGVEKTVGPECVVVWQHREQGGGHRYYNGKARDSGPSIPTITSNGMDMSAIGGTLITHFQELIQKHGFEGLEETQEDLTEELNEKLRALPEDPDEGLT